MTQALPIAPAEYRAVLRDDLMSFIERAFLELEPSKGCMLPDILEVLAARLEACHRGDCKRLIICMPPRHLKSIAASIAFVAWLLGHNPSRQIVCASYGQDLSDDMARKCRKLMTSDFYKSVFATRLDDRQAVNDFVTVGGGGRLSTSVGGVVTGRGGEIIVIDDPMKPDEALSDTRARPSMTGTTTRCAAA